ncbi:MAG: phosphatidylinositol-specific phospholipase C/glycerophosphodiester phosphodiesterase family protein [Bacteroidetes bacterium]|nr:phosphatidylinositol-specific phospholipase C/glycerophosphodiester phosphodiesterase family protein [Bacteroidota bacterium]
MKKGPFFIFTAVVLCLTARTAEAQQGTTAQPSAQAAAAAAPAMEKAASNAAFPGWLMTGKEKYTVANTHSHNDYAQSIPFWMAWQEKFGSIEADIFLQDGRLFVGHNREEIKLGRTLEEYYVRPLANCIEKNNGHPYADSGRRLQILIDIKADSVNALNALVALLDRYPALEHCPNIKWVISGNRPAPSLYTTYPSFIAFDGILGREYTPEALSRIVMMSEDLRALTRWNGVTGLPAADRSKIEDAIARAHGQHLPVRFWDAPDTPAAWKELIRLRVDYINTDHIRELATYLNEPAP